jgi:ATP-dependent DNA ligase
VPRFNLLQNYRSGRAHLMYFVFDLLVHKGKHVSKVPLSDRRVLLRSTVTRSDHIHGLGDTIHSKAPRRRDHFIST